MPTPKKFKCPVCLRNYPFDIKKYDLVDDGGIYKVCPECGNKPKESMDKINERLKEERKKHTFKEWEQYERDRTTGDS
jgi:hypothetical protein